VPTGGGPRQQACTSTDMSSNSTCPIPASDLPTGDTLREVGRSFDVRLVSAANAQAGRLRSQTDHADLPLHGPHGAFACSAVIIRSAFPTPVTRRDDRSTRGIVLGGPAGRPAAGLEHRDGHRGSAPQGCMRLPAGGSRLRVRAAPAAPQRARLRFARGQPRTGPSRWRVLTRWHQRVSRRHICSSDERSRLVDGFDEGACGDFSVAENVGA
jgi:hypothetical protein